MLRKLDSERAGRCGFADTTFSADEDPAESLLFEYGQEGRLHGVEVVAVYEGGARHVGGCTLSWDDYAVLRYGVRL